MTPRFTWLLDADTAEERLDTSLARLASCSHAAARRLIDGDLVRLNGRRARKGERVRPGDRIELDGEPPNASSLRPCPQPELALAVLFEDGDLVVVNKPAGMPSQPLRPGEGGTVANAVVARYPECANVGRDPREAGLVHRLDSNTSGALALARNAEAWQELRRAFHEHRVMKEYAALVGGEVRSPLTIDAPLTHRGRRMAIDHTEGLEALTEAEPLAVAHGLTLLRVRATTGRMHQVRAHLAYVDHPLVGDELYGGPLELEGAPGTFLHASRLVLPRPRSDTVDVRAPLPAERALALARLGIAGERLLGQRSD